MSKGRKQKKYPGRINIAFLCLAVVRAGMNLPSSATGSSLDDTREQMEEAERESARPGTSQHQLGSAIDFGSITDDFDETTMGKWLYANASKYGWSLSFPKNYEDITGYRWECWHFRYIGVPACQMQRKWFGNVQQYMLEFIDLWKKY